MSELNAFELKVGKNLETDSPLIVGVDGKWNSRVMSGEKVYLESEADKVIARHKYKRCLANANYWVAISYHCVDDKHRKKAEKRHYKWLELAEKFKEAK